MVEFLERKEIENGLSENLNGRQDPPAVLQSACCFNHKIASSSHARFKKTLTSGLVVF